MKRFEKSPLILAAAVISTALTSCSAGGTDLSQIAAAITAEFPNCSFEDLTVETGKTYETSTDETSRVWMSYMVNEMDFIYAKDAEGNDDWNKPATGVTFKGAGSSENYKVCNTKGKSLDWITADNSYAGQTLEDAVGQNFCWVPGRAPTASEKKIFAKCEKRLETQSRVGFWFGVHEFDSAEQATEMVTARLDNQWQHGGYSAYPMALVGNVVIFVQGPLDSVNQATVDELDLAWQRIIKALDATPASALVDGYPDSFDRAKWSQYNNNADAGSRHDLNLAYDRLARYLTCNGTLSISELEFAPGTCGKLPVEVFQSDLNTGSCNFLGYWTDKSGNRRIGVFEYCDAFSEGSIEEDSNYRLKVRATGTTSYQTKLGYQNEVVAFTVVGDY